MYDRLGHRKSRGRRSCHSVKPDDMHSTSLIDTILYEGDDTIGEEIYALKSASTAGEDSRRLALPYFRSQAVQKPGTATFWNRCGLAF